MALTPEFIDGPAWSGVHSLVTTRRGGVSTGPYESFNVGRRAGDDPEAVIENLARLAQYLPGPVHWVRQVHGAHVVVPGEDILDMAEEPPADAQVTTARGRVLAVLAADCLPVLLTDEHATVLGVAHAGWRGLAAGVLENTLEAMRQLRPEARGWRAWVGPGIGPSAFEVGDDVWDAFCGHDANATVFFQERVGVPGKWLADLPGLAGYRLRQAGVAAPELSGLCTYSDPARFYSYRRDGASGRMAMVAWLGA